MTNLTPLHIKDVLDHPQEDPVLLAGIARGDMTSMAAFYTRYQNDVFRFLARLSGTESHELDDLVQTTFLQVIGSAKNFQHRSSVKSWLFAIAANVSRQHVRKSIRRKKAYHILQETPVHLPIDANGADAAETHAQLRAVQAAMATLSHKLRVVFVMCDIEGISGVDAARLLKVNEGTLWRRLHDARKKLARQVERDVPSTHVSARKGGRPQ